MLIATCPSGMPSKLEPDMGMHGPAPSGYAMTGWSAFQLQTPCPGRRYLPLDTAALITRSEFLHAVQQLKQHSADPWKIVKHQSSKQLNEDKFRHRRPVSDPQRCFQRPMISQQVSLQTSTCKHHAEHSGPSRAPGNFVVKVGLEHWCGTMKPFWKRCCRC